MFNKIKDVFNQHSQACALAMVAVATVGMMANSYYDQHYAMQTLPQPAKIKSVSKAPRADGYFDVTAAFNSGRTDNFIIRKGVLDRVAEGQCETLTVSNTQNYLLFRSPKIIRDAKPALGCQ